MARNHRFFGPLCRARWTPAYALTPRSDPKPLQRELLDQHTWDTRDQLALALFDWIETWSRYAGDRHSYNGGLSPIDYETAHAA